MLGPTSRNRPIIHFRCSADPHNHTYSESSWHVLSTDAPAKTKTNTNTKTKTKTKTKWLKDPTCAIFSKMVWLKDFHRFSSFFITFHHFLGPRGPLGTPSSVRSFVRPSARPQEKSKSPPKPYKSSKDHARPLIWNIAARRTMSSIKDKDKDRVLKRPNICYIFGKQGVQGHQIWHLDQTRPVHSGGPF